MEEKKYYGQQCQDELINIAFRHLHENLVNEIIGFCRAYGITIDEFYLNADCLKDSIKAGSWQPCTDSCLKFDKFPKEKVAFANEIDKAWDTYNSETFDNYSYKDNIKKKAENMEEGFKNIYGISYKEFKELTKDINPKEPFLFSM
ncbi:hypothetical protein IKN40_04890 [bacterium]|nr:hypothetical protein [bacterium]